MKHLVLGILVVFCLQLGFNAYNAIDRQGATLVAINEVTSGTNPVANVFDISNDDRFLNGDNVEYVSDQPALWTRGRRAGFVPVKAVLFLKKGVPTANESPVSMQKPLKNITITYQRPTQAATAVKTSAPSAAVAAYTEKRSFASKSVSVIKKPYDWLKAVGSRIR